MSYIIAVPSYNRSEICNAKTLAMLSKNKIPKDIIHVYVANEEEYDKYMRVLNPDLYGIIAVGVIGLVPQRQYIMEQFPTGTHIVFIDDDIDLVDLSLSSKFKDESLDHFFTQAFTITAEHNAFIWGLYPVFNPYFRSPLEEVSKCLKYICGGLYGIINRPDNTNIVLTLTAENGQKEDVERSIRYFVEDGIVIRFNRIGFVTKNYGKVGGLGTFKQRLEPMKDASELLQQTYPKYGKVFCRKNGMTEFRLKKLPARLQ